jgi:hypothetical protein
MVSRIYLHTIEAFWSLMKRGVVGAFHKVSAKYLPLYVAGFSSGTTIGQTPTFSEPR